MGLLKKDVFVCVDCESTGLDPNQDRIIEVAAVRFTWDALLDSFETLVDPECQIPSESIEIHHITQEMVTDKPKIGEVLPDLLAFVGRDPIVGHGVQFDIDLIIAAAKRCGIPCRLGSSLFLDTLRLARLYGESAGNSLEKLRCHFNIAAEGAHRAMSDVIVNVEVFKQLAKQFKTTEAILKRLAKPIEMRRMPLGKHKGRRFGEIPVEYLRWAVTKDFDQDLMYSIKMELKRRRKGGGFSQEGNPFQNL